MANRAGYDIQLQPGTRVAERYEIVRKVGEGSYGVVYEARQLDDGLRVAIKILKRQQSAEEQEEILARFGREIETMSQLSHPNSIRLFDSGVRPDGARFVVLEFLEGSELKKLIQGQPIAPQLARHVIISVCGALAEAHAQGIVHRDVKPANIMLTGDLQNPVVKVLDFGIAAIQEGFRSESYQQLTMAGQTRGTPAYMAPEQLAKNEITARTDIYATGLVLLECLMGKRAVQGATAVDTCIKQLKGEIDFPDAIRRTPLGAVVAKAIAQDADLRYQDAGEMLAALEALNPATLTHDAPSTGADGAPRTMALPSIPPIDGGEEVHDDATQMLDTSEAMGGSPRSGARHLAPKSEDARPQIVDDGIPTQAMAAIPVKMKDSSALALDRLRDMGESEVTLHIKNTQPMKPVGPAHGGPPEHKKLSPTPPPHVQRLPTPPPNMPTANAPDDDSTVARLLVLLALVIAVLLAAGGALYVLGYLG